MSDCYINNSKNKTTYIKMLFFYSLILSVVYLLTIYIKNRKNVQKIRKNLHSIDEINGLPMIGHAHKVLFSWNNKFELNLKNLLVKLSSINNSCVLWVFNKLIIYVTTPEDVKIVLTSADCLDRLATYKLIVGDNDGFISMNAFKWKSHRKLLNSSFSLQILKSFMTDANQIANKLVFDLKSYAVTEEVFEVTHLISLRLVELQLQTVFGEKRIGHDKVVEIHEILESSMKLWDKKLINLLPMVLKDKFIKLCGGNTQDEIFYSMLINQFRSVVDSQSGDDTDDDYLLKKLVHLHETNQITERDIYNHLIDVIMAGTDTSTIGIANVLLCLAMHPEIQEHTYQNIQTVWNTIGDDTITYDNLTEFTHLDRVMKESFRLLPIVSMIGRTSSTEINLTHGTIPPNTDIFIPILNIHRSKFIWGENAAEFNPDNFLPENNSTRPNCSFIPFGYGPRNCIGSKYAQSFIKIILINLITNYKFQTNLKLSELDYNLRITATLPSGHLIKITNRK